MSNVVQLACYGRYLSDQVLVLHHSQLSACRLGDALPGHQVADKHGGRADVHWVDGRTDSHNVSGADRHTGKQSKSPSYETLLMVYLAASAWAWAYWSHRCGGT